MNGHHLRVHHLPREVPIERLAGSTVIVVDVLRASSTICQALASGAQAVVPFLEVEETRAAAERAGRSNVVLAGERKGCRITGFDLGNSPSEFTPKSVGGRQVFMTTTNGTRALDHARLASRVLVGSFLNLSAIVDAVQHEPRVDILCAGTDGEATREDNLAAGAIASRLMKHWKYACDPDEAAEAAGYEWQKVLAGADAAGRTVREQLALELRETSGGRNLLGIGLDRDLTDCAQIDGLNIVPEFEVRGSRIAVR
jgi:2-phosphosulfolactate phosphatase